MSNEIDIIFDISFGMRKNQSNAQIKLGIHDVHNLDHLHNSYHNKNFSQDSILLGMRGGLIKAVLIPLRSTNSRRKTTTSQLRYNRYG